MTEIEKGSGNIYADLGISDAGDMLVKARLATKIGEIIKVRDWTRQEAARAFGMTQNELSKMLRGQFREMPEATFTRLLPLTELPERSLKALLLSDAARVDFNFPRRHARRRTLRLKPHHSGEDTDP